MTLYISLLASLVCLVSSQRHAEARNASVTYDKVTARFCIHESYIPDAVAVATFKDEIFVTGWAYLEVKTNEQYPDPLQAYAAGLVEAYLTADLQQKHWYNTLSDYCDGDSSFSSYCIKLVKFLRTNLNFLNDNIKARRSHDVYWHQIALILEQLKGLEDGYNNITGQPSTDLNVMGMLLLNIQGDIEDLEVIFNKNPKSSVFGSGSCSALIKVLPGFKDLYFAHNTWRSYSTMLRILKKYIFNFHTTLAEGSPVIPGHTCTFPSQPGVIHSADDFYLTSSGLAIMETTISNVNASLWQYVRPEGTVLELQRNIIANRLAKTGEQWTQLFGIMNSGTYNNQWMIVDYNRFKPGKPLQDGLLWVLEQLPGYVHSEDKTDVLRAQSYWPSYNIPFFKDIFNLSGAPINVDKYGDWFSYEGSPRFKMFKRDHSKVSDIDSMIKLMRYNDYKNDPLSRCNCTPPYTAENAISSRCDLNPADGKYPFPALGHRQHGATDMKLTSYKLIQRHEFVAISGPTYDPLPPFQWSKSDFDKTVKHEGHPDLWKFEPIIHKWSL